MFLLFRRIQSGQPERSESVQELHQRQSCHQSKVHRWRSCPIVCLQQGRVWAMRVTPLRLRYRQAVHFRQTESSKSNDTKQDLPQRHLAAFVRRSKVIPSGSVTNLCPVFIFAETFRSFFRNSLKTFCVSYVFGYFMIGLTGFFSVIKNKTLVSDRKNPIFRYGLFFFGRRPDFLWMTEKIWANSVIIPKRSTSEYFYGEF